MRAGHEPVMDRELVRQITSLRDFDRVDLADEIGDRDVRRRELLAVALVAQQPHELDRIAVVGDAVFARGADRLERIVVDLTARDGRRDLVEQLDEHSRDAGLRLAALAEKDDVLAGQDRVLDLRDHRRFVADDALKELALLGERGDEVRAELLLHRAALKAGLAQLADGLRSVCHSTGSPLMSLGTGSPRYDASAARTSGMARQPRPRRSVRCSVRRSSSSASASRSALWRSEWIRSSSAASSCSCASAP